MKIWLVVEREKIQSSIDPIRKIVKAYPKRELADLYASISNYVAGESLTYYDVIELKIEDLKHLEVEE